MQKPKHILVIRLSAMGDVAMTIPVLTALTEQYPKLKVTVVTRGFFKPFFRDLQNVSVFPVDTKGKHKGVFGLYRLSKELKTLGFDAVADIHNVLRSTLLKFFFLGKKVVQIDKGRTEKKALVNGKKFEQLTTTHQRYASVFQTLGFPIDMAHPRFPKKVELPLKLNAFISNPNFQTIGIAPFAAFAGKMYPLDNIRLVIEVLSKDHNILLFGGGTKEIELLSQLEAEFKNTASVAGQLNLDEELDVISNLDIMLSMDSGNAHIAAMLGVKVITIWGVTHPFAGFAPFNQPENYAVLADRNKYPLIPTSIYGNKQPEGYENAARSILVEEIISKLKTVI